MCILVQEASAFFARTGLGEVPQVLLNGVPLQRADLDPDNFEEAVVGQILKMTPELQRAVYNVSLYQLRVY